MTTIENRSHAIIVVSGITQSFLNYEYDKQQIFEQHFNTNSIFHYGCPDTPQEKFTPLHSTARLSPSNSPSLFETIQLRFRLTCAVLGRFQNTILNIFNILKTCREKYHHSKYVFNVARCFVSVLSHLRTNAWQVICSPFTICD